MPNNEPVNNPNAEPEPPKTAKEAAAIAGAAVGYRGTYGSGRDKVPESERIAPPAGSAAEAEIIAARKAEFRGTYRRYGGLPILLARNIEAKERSEQAQQQTRRTGTTDAQGRTWIDEFHWRDEVSGAEGVAGVEPVPVATEGEHPGDIEVFDTRGQRVAEFDPSDRPNYYPVESLGDTTTENFVRMNNQMNISLRAMGMPTIDSYQLAGNLLEAQRDAAYKTPGKTDDFFFLGEIQKWSSIGVETSAEYHQFGQRLGVPVNPNPYENWGDVSLALLKGGNQKDDFARNYAFNPNVGALTKSLPGGKGLQETGWDMATANYKNRPFPAPVSFAEAIKLVSASRFSMGIYGTLARTSPAPTASQVTEPFENNPAAAATVQRISSQHKNFDEFYNTLVADYETRLGAYTAAGANDESVYKELVSERGYIEIFRTASIGNSMIQQGMSMYDQVAREQVYSSPKAMVAPQNDWISEINTGIFQRIPVLRDINTAGRVATLDIKSRDLSTQLNAQYAQYEREGLIKNNEFRGTPEQYSSLRDVEQQLGAFQQEHDTLAASLVAGVPAINRAMSGIGLQENADAFYRWSQGAANEYRTGIADPMDAYNKKNMQGRTHTGGAAIVDSSVSALVHSPEVMLNFAGMVPSGVVTVARNPATFPALVAAGIVMQGQGIVEGLTTRPAEFIVENAAMMAVFHYAGKGVRAANPIGFGTAVLPSFETGIGSKYYMAYLKTPFSTVERGGKPIAGVSRIYTYTNEVQKYAGAESLQGTTRGITFRKSLGTFRDANEAQRYFTTVADSGKRTFMHATGDVDFMNRLITDKKMVVGENFDIAGDALFFGSPDVLYTKFLKGSTSPRLGGGIVRITTTAKITPEFIDAANRVALGEKMGAAAKTLPPGMYPGLRPWAGKAWKGVGIENEFIIPSGTKLNVTGISWIQRGGKRVPVVDVSLYPRVPGSLVADWAASRLSTIFNPNIRTRPFLGSPADIIASHDVNIASPFAVNVQWGRAEFAAMNSRIMGTPPSLEQAIWESIPPAIEASKSRYYNPVQRELMGEFPTPAAGRSTMADIYGVAESRGNQVITGGSRTIKAWTGEYGRGSSLADIDFWTYKANMRDLYGDMLAVVERDYPGSSKLSYTYLKETGAKPGFSIVTGKEYFLSAHRVETFPFVAENTLPMKTIGGHTIQVPSPAQSLRMKASGMFASISQRAGKNIQFNPLRAKDAVDAYSLSGTIARDLYAKRPTLDAGGIVSGHINKQAHAMENFAFATRGYINSLQDAETLSMFAEIKNDPLARLDVSVKPARVDVLTGEGFVPTRYHTLYQRGTMFAGATGLALAAPMVGLPKLVGFAGAVLLETGKKSERVVKSQKLPVSGRVKAWQASDVLEVEQAYRNTGKVTRTTRPAQLYPVSPAKTAYPKAPAVNYQIRPAVTKAAYPVIKTVKYPTTTTAVAPPKYPTTAKIQKYPVITTYTETVPPYPVPKPTPTPYTPYIETPPKVPYPTVTPPTKYPPTRTPPPPWYYGYPPDVPVPPTTNVPPWYPGKTTRKRRKKHLHTPFKFFIHNPVPSYETVFEYQLGIYQEMPKVKQPSMKIKKYKFKFT